MQHENRIEPAIIWVVPVGIVQFPILGKELDWIAEAGSGYNIFFLFSKDKKYKLFAGVTLLLLVTFLWLVISFYSKVTFIIFKNFLEKKFWKK